MSQGVWGIVMMLMLGVVKVDPEYKYSLTYDNLPPTTCDYDVTHL